MATTAVYRLTNLVILRVTTDATVGYDPALEGTHPEAAGFSLANGPWKYGNTTAWVKTQATQQEYQDALKDPELETLKQACLDFDAASQAMQDANPATYTAFYNLFKPWANSLRTVVKQQYKAITSP